MTASPPTCDMCGAAMVWTTELDPDHDARAPYWTCPGNPHLALGDLEPDPETGLMCLGVDTYAPAEGDRSGEMA